MCLKSSNSLRHHGFLYGITSLFAYQYYGNHKMSKLNDHSLTDDNNALKKDFEAIGSDMRKAIKQWEMENKK